MGPNGSTRPRIAIPLPHGSDPAYAERAMPQYEQAIVRAGGEPVRITLEPGASEITNLIRHCDGVLLPGSKADIDPARFHAPRSPKTAAADPPRDEVDSLLLDHAYRSRKPVLGICYGLQSLNVYRAGSLIQHIPDFLPEEIRTKINHEAGARVPVAHSVEIDSESLLAKILCPDGHARKPARNEDSGSNASSPAHLSSQASKITLPVNSSHHQSADRVGAGLRIIARCPDDGIIEALEGTAANHFVLAVQWHPERSLDQDEASRKIFRAFLEAAAQRER